MESRTTRREIGILRTIKRSTRRMKSAKGKEIKRDDRRKYGE
jgi:hypothetical protein